MTQPTVVRIFDNEHFAGTWRRSDERDASWQHLWYLEPGERGTVVSRSHPLTTGNIDRMIEIGKAEVLEGKA